MKARDKHVFPRTTPPKNTRNKNSKFSVGIESEEMMTRMMMMMRRRRRKRRRATVMMTIVKMSDCPPKC
jgi:hypothetical protein